MKVRKKIKYTFMGCLMVSWALLSLIIIRVDIYVDDVPKADVDILESLPTQYEIDTIINSTNYDSFIKDNSLYNYGMVQGSNNKEIYLTIDLCPSSHTGFEEKLFRSLIKLSKEQRRAIPVTIFLTAKWVIHHEDNFNQLLKWQQQGYLDIAWGNHTHDHYYNPKLPENKNFMLHDKKQAQKEISDNDKFMRSRGLTPSVFFRFPGLIADRDLIHLMKKFHLVPIGAGAWLAKSNGEFQGGDVILIHGNKLEPEGVEIFLNNLKLHKFDEFTFAPLINILNKKTVYTILVDR